MVQAGDPGDEFDINDEGIIFAATEYNVKDPRKFWLSSIYHLPLVSFCEASAQGVCRISLQTDIDPRTKIDQSYCSQPRFSPSGTMIAFLRSPSDRPLNTSIWLKHIESRSAIDIFLMVTGKRWNLLASGFEFAPNSHAIYIKAPDSGTVALYKLNLLPNAEPQVIMRNGSVSAYYNLRQDADSISNLLVTSSSFVEPWVCQIIDTNVEGESEPWVISRTSQHVNLGLSRKQVSEIYFEGAGDYVVQAWVVKPRDFDPKNKKYPLCLHVHGGPNGSWSDTWSTRVS
jgi:dipeptidyl aminopeptidase/acylaminoacyl peptidase